MVDRAQLSGGKVAEKIIIHSLDLTNHQTALLRQLTKTCRLGTAENYGQLRYKSAEIRQQAAHDPVIPDIDREKNRPARDGGQTQQGLVIGIVDRILAQSRTAVQPLFKDIAQVELGQTGVGITAVDADKVKPQRKIPVRG
jgi:hypothetical protein